MEEILGKVTVECVPTGFHTMISGTQEMVGLKFVTDDADFIFALTRTDAENLAHYLLNTASKVGYIELDKGKEELI